MFKNKNILRSILIIGNIVILCIYIFIRYVEMIKIFIEYFLCFVFCNVVIIVDV